PDLRRPTHHGKPRTAALARVDGRRQRRLPVSAGLRPRRRDRHVWPRARPDRLRALPALRPDQQCDPGQGRAAASRFLTATTSSTPGEAAAFPGVRTWAIGCLIALLALLSPRLALFLLWIFSDVLSRAFDSWIVPLLGFFLLPWTTLAYAAFWDWG